MLPYNAAQKVARKPLSTGNTSNQVSHKSEKKGRGRKGGTGLLIELQRKNFKALSALGLNVNPLLAEGLVWVPGSSWAVFITFRSS